MESKEINNIYNFHNYYLPNIAEIGGKGYSLLKMTNAKLKVPPGIILTVNYFQTWTDELKRTNHWNNFVHSTTEEEKILHLNHLKKICSELEYTHRQESDLRIAMNDLSYCSLYAVRSSSPEEDLEGASFAGGYETVLGVTHETLKISIKKIYASCLDYRVFKYKLEKGYDTYDFKIAIIIMAQISSDISGVAFSLNPVNNDHDEVVIASNWGLGETVVGGQVNPDHYVINKINRAIIEKNIGKKEISIFLNKTGGTHVTEDPRHNEETLTDKQINEIVEQISFVEEYYKLPIDLEWAIEDSKLYLLQARPITTHYVLPKSMLTQPGEQRYLYLDITLCVQGAEKPYSTLGSSFINKLFSLATEKVFGSKNVFNIKSGVGQSIGGKIFFNCSNIWTKINKNSFVEKFRNMNATAAEILKDCCDSYIASKVPIVIDFCLLGMAWRLPVTKLIFPNFLVNKIKNGAIKAVQDFDSYIESTYESYISRKISIRIFIDNLLNKFVYTIVNFLMPCLVNGAINGLNKINSLFENLAKDNHEIRKMINELIRCLPNNVTNDMGIRLYKLSLHLNKDIYCNFDVLKEHFANNILSQNFYHEWNEFNKLYGCRGEGELDIANSRYADDLNTILKQVHNCLISYNKENNPIDMFENTEKYRPEIFSKLSQIANENNFGKPFRKAWELCYNLFGFRETHKYLLIKIIGLTRSIILNYSDDLVKLNILSDRNEIFKLSIDNIMDMQENKTNLERETVEKIIHKENSDRRIFLRWKTCPMVIDSRGRIINSKPKCAKPGEFIGQSVSFGKVRGRAKIMKSINDKIFLPGDILVTVATDPGWTPLIINSAAVVLEIGGMLQHGALVSREFGKPCIVGIENVTNLIKDGEIIEVDAIDGIVRKIENDINN